LLYGFKRENFDITFNLFEFSKVIPSIPDECMKALLEIVSLFISLFLCLMRIVLLTQASITSSSHENHWSFRACSGVALSSGFFYVNFKKRDLALGGRARLDSIKESLAKYMLEDKIDSISFPLNNIFPVNRLYNTTPALNISTGNE
jgi:hypothetical protein